MEELWGLAAQTAPETSDGLTERVRERIEGGTAGDPTAAAAAIVPTKAGDIALPVEKLGKEIRERELDSLTTEELTAAYSSLYGEPDEDDKISPESMRAKIRQAFQVAQEKNPDAMWGGREPAPPTVGS